MIAQCPSCSARFRVADEKVPDKGVKVRCTKCATVFKVTKADAAPPATPAPADDFGLGLSAPTPPPRAPAPPLPPKPAAPPPSARRAQSFDIGEATGPVPLPSAGSFGGPVSATAGPQGMAGPVSLPYGAASPQNSLDLDLSLGPPSPPARAPAAPPRKSAPPPSQLNAIDAALDAAMASASGGFDALDLGAPPPPPPAPPARATPAFASAPASSVDPFANLSLDTGSDDPFGGLGAAAPVPPPRAPAARAVPPPAPPPAPELGASDPFALDADFGSAPALELNAPPAFQSPAFPQSQPRQAPPPSQDPFAALDGNAGLDALGEVPAPERSMPPPERSVPPPERSLPPERPPAVSDAPSEDAGPARGPNNEFDFGADGGDAPPPLEGDAAVPAELAKIRLSKPRAESSSAAPAAPSPARPRSEFLAALFNVGSAAVVGLAAIVSIALIRSPRPLTPADLGFPLVWIALGLDDGASERLVRTRKVTTTTYPTRAGADVFVVRGEVANTGSAPRGAVTVVVEVLRGGTLVSRAESVAGLAAGPQDIFLQDSRRNDELQHKLAKQAATISLGAQSALPFVAILPLGASEAAGCNVRLSVVDGIPVGLEGAFAAGVVPALRDVAPEQPAAPEPSTDAAPAVTPDAGP